VPLTAGPCTATNGGAQFATAARPGDRADRSQPGARQAVATEYYGVALSPLVSIRDGDYADLADAGLAIITAGVDEMAGGATDRSDPAGRLRLKETVRRYVSARERS
jgi:hypothetical protein